MLASINNDSMLNVFPYFGSYLVVNNRCIQHHASWYKNECYGLLFCFVLFWGGGQVFICLNVISQAQR